MASRQGSRQWPCVLHLALAVQGAGCAVAVAAAWAWAVGGGGAGEAALPGALPGEEAREAREAVG
jgi:hypothetical protein